MQPYLKMGPCNLNRFLDTPQVIGICHFVSNLAIDELRNYVFHVLDYQNQKVQSPARTSKKGAPRSGRVARLQEQLSCGRSTQ